MSNEIDYENVVIPEENAPEKCTYAERRVEVLERMREAGHPRAVNCVALADRYGCTRQNVHKDMDILADYIAENVGSRQEF